VSRLFLDEDVPESVAAALRLRGHDVMTVRESKRKGLSDAEQLDYAHSEQRIFVTHNIADFVKIHNRYEEEGKEHSGLILAKQLPIGVIVKALLVLLADRRSAQSRNTLMWLSDWVA
jgi:hypothetical protein